MNNSILLINPPLSLEERYGKEMAKFGAVTEPLGLAYVAGMLEKNGIPVAILDSQAENFSDDQIIAHIKNANRYTIIGIAFLTPMHGVIKRLCDSIKQNFNNILIVLGGPHCTALKEQVLVEIESADVICIGEGELTISELANIIAKEELKSIQGICYRDGDQIFKNPPRPFINDLDSIPPPARHLLPMAKYHLTASRVSGNSYCPTIIVARGCPFSCTYCSRIFGRTLRMHSIDRILAEIEFLYETYHINQLNIEADTLTANKKFLENLCNGLINSGISKNIKWTCESRVDTVDEQSLRLMKTAGCWQISYGVETGSQRLLDMINKGTSLQQIEKVFALTKKIGISIRGFFMLGLPEETYNDSLATIEFAKKLDPLWAQFTLTTPYPGTKLFEDLSNKGEIRNYNWENYNTWSGWKEIAEIPFIPKGRTIEELAYLQKLAMRKFYLRPKYIFNSIKNIRTIDDLKKYFAGFTVLLKTFKSN